jgi:tetrahydromethanopterin S-methyltransferase subunit E
VCKCCCKQTLGCGGVPPIAGSAVMGTRQLAPQPYNLTEMVKKRSSGDPLSAAVMSFIAGMVILAVGITTVVRHMSNDWLWLPASVSFLAVGAIWTVRYRRSRQMDRPNLNP